MFLGLRISLHLCHLGNLHCTCVDHRIVLEELAVQVRAKNEKCNLKFALHYGMIHFYFALK
jgi:hypothetical protein